MFRSVLLATFRTHRRAAVVWGLALAFFTVFSMWSNWRNEYPTEEARQRLAQQVESGGLVFAQAVFGQPRQVDQFAGHVEWRALGLYPLLLSLFMVLASTGTTRGAEERGELDVLLTVPRGRLWLLAGQAAGLWIALLLACVLVWLGVLVSGPVAGESEPPLGRAALAVLNLGLAATMFGAFGLLVAQFFRSRRAAATAAGIVLIAAYLWSNLGLVAESLESWRWLSPLYLYSRSSPLATGDISLPALGLTALIILVCAAAAAWVFNQRDIQTAVRPPLPRILARGLSFGQVKGSRGWLLGNSFQRALRSALGPAIVWGLGLALLAALVTAATPSIREGFADLPEAQQAVESLEFELTSDSGILSSLLFLLLPVLVAVIGCILSSSFASEEQSGRFELDLTSSIGRQHYFFSRIWAAMATLATVIGLTGAAFLMTARLMNLDLDWPRAAVAVVLLVLPAAVTVAFGYAVAGWRPSLVASSLAAAIAASFFFDLLAPALDAPEAVRKFSVFQLYGRPLLNGVQWNDVALMVGLIGTFSALGGIAFGRRDIVK